MKCNLCGTTMEDGYCPMCRMRSNDLLRNDEQPASSPVDSQAAGSVPLSDDYIAMKMLVYLKEIKRITGKPMYDTQMMLGLLDVVRDLEEQNDLA